MIGDYLKKFRGSGYSGKSDKAEIPEESDENPDQKSRIINLTDDEKKAFEGTKPGEDLGCEVHGSLQEDGSFNVMSVSPLGGKPGYGSEEEMAGAVAGKVMPGMPMGG